MPESSTHPKASPATPVTLVRPPARRVADRSSSPCSPTLPTCSFRGARSKRSRRPICRRWHCLRSCGRPPRPGARQPAVGADSVLPAGRPAPAQQEEVAPAVKRTTILLLGVDARPGQKIARTDSIILLTFNPETNAAGMLSIPRDLKVRPSRAQPGHEDHVRVPGRRGRRLSRAAARPCSKRPSRSCSATPSTTM